ncbi:MAG: hypothetical protein AABX07_01040 [Nanoarchaeota archaeon]
MKDQQLCLMPAKCNKCGELFDLSYDLARANEEIKDFGVLSVLARAKQKALLCWDCRSIRFK